MLNWIYSPFLLTECAYILFCHISVARQNRCHSRTGFFTESSCCKCVSFVSAASENCHDFHPMFFTHDRSFEEFFCICIQLLNKTWKEMRATSEDFNKVHGKILFSWCRRWTNFRYISLILYVQLQLGLEYIYTGHAWNGSDVSRMAFQRRDDFSQLEKVRIQKQIQELQYCFNVMVLLMGLVLLNWYYHFTNDKQ